MSTPDQGGRPPPEGPPKAYVTAEPCRDVLDRACVEECPLDCIYEGDRVLYIHPDECVGCGACEPACPLRRSTTRTTSRSNGLPPGCAGRGGGFQRIGDEVGAHVFSDRPASPAHHPSHPLVVTRWPPGAASLSSAVIRGGPRVLLPTWIARIRPARPRRRLPAEPAPPPLLFPPKSWWAIAFLALKVLGRAPTLAPDPEGLRRGRRPRPEQSDPAGRPHPCRCACRRRSGRRSTR